MFNRSLTSFKNLELQKRNQIKGRVKSVKHVTNPLYCYKLGKILYCISNLSTLKRNITK